MRYMFLLDSKRCIGCGACAVACMDQNDIMVQNGEKPYRQCFAVEMGTEPKAAVSYLSMACMHCADAPCVQGCPVGCLQKDEETGFTVYDSTNCIGCHSCAMACPFSAPCFNGSGKMVKCNGCIDRVKQGLLPACVRVCPYGALKLVDEAEYAATRKQTAGLLAYTAFGRKGRMQ